MLLRVVDRLALGFSLALLSAGVANAIPLPDSQGALINTLGNVGNFSPPPYNVGWQFDLSASYDVTHLGYLDEGTNGFSEVHDVGIFACTTPACTASAGLIVSASVTSLDPLQNGFRWVTVPTVTLGAGSYIVNGTAGTELYQWSGGSVTFDPSVTWVAGRYEGTAALVFPTLVNPNPPISYFGPNFGTTVIPEPGTIALFASGLVILGLRRRNRWHS